MARRRLKKFSRKRKLSKFSKRARFSSRPRRRISRVSMKRRRISSKGTARRKSRSRSRSQIISMRNSVRPSTLKEHLVALANVPDQVFWAHTGIVTSSTAGLVAELELPMSPTGTQITGFYPGGVLTTTSNVTQWVTCRTKLTLRNLTHIPVRFDVYLGFSRQDQSSRTISGDINVDTKASGTVNAELDPRWSIMQHYKQGSGGALRQNWTLKKVGFFILGMNGIKEFTYNCQWTPFDSDAVLGTKMAPKHGTRFPIMYIRACGEMVSATNGAIYPPVSSSGANVMTYSTCSIGAMITQVFHWKTTTVNTSQEPVLDPFAVATGYVRQWNNQVIPL